MLAIASLWGTVQNITHSDKDNRQETLGITDPYLYVPVVLI